MAKEIRVNINEMAALPKLIERVSIPVAKRAMARTLKETIRATRTAAVRAVKGANVVKLKTSELNAGASSRMVSKRGADGSVGQVQRKGGSPYFITRVDSGREMPLAAHSAEFRVSDYHINLFRFFARRVRVANQNQVVNFGTAQDPVFRRIKRPLYGANVRVMGKSYRAGRSFILQRGSSGILIERLKGVMRAERKPWGRKLWGPSMATITDGTGVNAEAAKAGRSTFARAIARNLEFFASRVNK